MISFKNVNRQILIKNPDFQDSKTLGTNLKVKTMMDGSMVTYRNKVRTIFGFRFSDLTRIKAEELRDFFNAIPGQRLTYTDPAGVDWSGFIITPDLEIENQGKGRGIAAGTVRAEAFGVSFQFEVADADSNL